MTTGTITNYSQVKYPQCTNNLCESMRLVWPWECEDNRYRACFLRADHMKGESNDVYSCIYILCLIMENVACNFIVHSLKVSLG